MNNMDLPVGMPEVHIVVAGTAQRDQSDAALVQLIDHIRVYRIIHENTDRIAPFREFDCVLGQLGFQKLKYQAGFFSRLFKGLSIIGFRIEKSYFDQC